MADLDKVKKILFLILVSPCCFARSLTFDTEVEFKDLSAATTHTIHKNEKLELSGVGASWIQASGKVPLLVVSFRDIHVDDLPIHLPNVTEWLPAETGRELDRSLEVLMEQLFTVQSLLATQKPKLARELLDRVQIRFPRVTYLDFMRASCLTMEGDHTGALAALNRALQSHPNHKEGNRLLKVLTEKVGK